MNILYIAISTIKRNFRDKRSLFRSILMPILMILVLGTALNKPFQGQTVDKVDVCYLQEDKGIGADEFNKFLGLVDIKNILNLKEVSSIDEGERLINDKKAVSLIVIPQGYSENLKEGKDASIKIYNSKYTDFKNGIVENIIDAYNSAGNAIMAAAKINPKEVGYNSFNTLEERSISTEGKSPRAIDYYGVAMLVLAIMSSATFASDMVGEDYFENVGARVKAAPVKDYERLAGKVLGCIFDIFIKGAVIIAFSKLAYNVNWGNNWGMVGLIIISAAAYATIFGMFITMLVGSSNRASGIISILNNVLTFFAGGYTLILAYDKKESILMHLSPNFYPQTALFNTIYSNSYRVSIQFFSTLGYIAMLWAGTLILGIGFIIVERRRVR